MISPILKRRFNSVDDLFKELESLREDNSYFFGTTIKKEDLIEGLSSSNGELSGYLFSAKDLISRSDSNVTGGSLFLKNYRPPFNSSVYVALKEAGAINLVQSNLDEFGLGGDGLSSAYGKIPNPIDKRRIIGGSSSGSAYLVHKNLIDFAITSDTGDSARYPASLVGVIGFKPSYGLVSRYGFFPFCSSFDTPSICASSMEVVAKVMSVISFEDKHDLCTRNTKKKNYLEEMLQPLNKLVKIAVLEDTFWSKRAINTDSHNKLKSKFYELLENLPKKMNVEIYFIKLKDNNIVRLCTLVYAIIAYSESVSNYSNLTGLLFPFMEQENAVKPFKKNVSDNYEDILFKNRAVLGDEFVFRQIVGKYLVNGENYESIYLQAKRFVSYVNEEVSKIFENYDLILSPTSFDIPSFIDKHEGKYNPSNDLNLRLWANFCALPAISIPWQVIQGMPIGLHLMSPYKTDGFLLNFANRILKLFK